MANRLRLAVRATRKRSVKTWLGTAAQGYVSIGTASKVLLASTAGFGLGTAGTIVRTRGWLSIRPTVENTSISLDGAFGIAVVSGTAVALGITAIPGPFTDDDWSGWLVHQYWGYRFLVSTAVGTELPALNFEIDSKAMRKVGGDEGIVLVGESRVGGVQVLSHMRLLFQEA